jgi:hypothetical protein
MGFEVAKAEPAYFLAAWLLSQTVKKKSRLQKVACRRR